MAIRKCHSGKVAPAGLAALSVIAVLAMPALLAAQPQHGAGHGPAQAQAQPQSLEERLNALQQQVALLESALKGGHKPASTATGAGAMQMGGMSGSSGNGGAAMPGMGGTNAGGANMGDMGMEGMGMADMNMERMGGMGMKMQGMGMGMGDMNMKRMGAMGGMKMGSSGTMASAQPGQPGTSHLLHVGSTGFFLDHPEHIDLSREQQSRLNQIREAWQLENANMQRNVEQAEQEVWTATAGAESAKIEAAVEKAEKLRSALRLAFVRAVMEASTVLTQEQKDVLLGVAAKTN